MHEEPKTIFIKTARVFNSGNRKPHSVTVQATEKSDFCVIFLQQSIQHTMFYDWLEYRNDLGFRSAGNPADTVSLSLGAYRFLDIYRIVVTIFTSLIVIIIR